ncbi:hypothetical protein B0J18DRAFT_451925 [Chaetomium sp. MPI-SDFR-AT-0129]|nr:hypothetical protein B0J18DRAFT_451925 [Chaetomium sp. MPI-SDFR-AT-0129]
MYPLTLLTLTLLLPPVSPSRTLFPFETIQLTPSDITTFPAVKFGTLPYKPPSTQPPCRAYPSTPSWPPPSQWSLLNSTLHGALLQPVPAAAACYPGNINYNATTCDWLIHESGKTHFWLDEPVSTLTLWPQGETCSLPSEEGDGSGDGSGEVGGECEQGGFPVYVVNASTVRDVQVGVNFARNWGLRLVIKNTGHDFGGRSLGAGSLSIWVHHLKDFEFLPEYSVGEYTGMAVRLGAGVESWEHFNHMAEHNISVVAPGGATVGAVGGWIAVAGHGALTSKYGLGVDQVLAVNVVTADGRFVSVQPDDQRDLWWALRGGGPSTFSVITSVTLKAHPPLTTTTTSLQLTLNPLSPTSPNRTTFWRAISSIYHFTPHILAAGGYTFSYIRPNLTDSTISFTISHTLPNIPVSDYRALLQPLYTELSALLPVPISLPGTITPTPYAGNGRRTGAGDTPINTRYHSRLFPSSLWNTNTTASREKWTTLWETEGKGIRAGVEEGGYVFHGIGYAPTREVAGWPGRDSAVNPAWRGAWLHGSLMDVQREGLSAGEVRAREERARGFLGGWNLTHAGSYMNEGDPGEPDWQSRFYGPLYDDLLKVKRKWDPWGVFWASTTVGSEDWEVVTADGYPMGQNGRLCRTDAGSR